MSETYINALESGTMTFEEALSRFISMLKNTQIALDDNPKLDINPSVRAEIDFICNQITTSASGWERAIRDYPQTPLAI